MCAKIVYFFNFFVISDFFLPPRGASISSPLSPMGHSNKKSSVHVHLVDAGVCAIKAFAVSVACAKLSSAGSEPPQIKATRCSYYGFRKELLGVAYIWMSKIPGFLISDVSFVGTTPHKHNFLFCFKNSVFDR